MGDSAMEAANPENQFVISRVFDAPRELVFKAWTEPERLAQWWGPTGMAIEVKKLELKPGGIFHYGLRGADGNEMTGLFRYREIRPSDRLSFVSSFADAEGNIARAPFSSEWPLEVLNVVTLEETGGKTTLTLRGGPINASPAEIAMFAGFHGSMQQGFGGTFDQLDAYLATL